MRRSTLSLGILSLLHAADPWCHCEDDEITLLQLNTRVQAETLPSVEGLLAKSALESVRHISHPGAEALLESVRHLARQATSESPEVVNTAIEAVQAALAQMRPKITDEHELAQLQIQRQWQEIQACHSSEVHGATVVGNLVTEISSIEDCRNEVAIDLTAQARDCDAWERHANVLVFPPCVTSGSGPAEVYERIRRLRDWANDAWTDVERMRGDCHQSTATHVATEARCRPEIDQYDEFYCQHFLSCRLLSDCHDHEVRIYRSLSSDTLAGQNSRQAQWRILIQADCILDLITGGVNTNETVNNASMSSCDDDDIDVSDLILSFQEPGRRPECPTRSAEDPLCPAFELPEGWDDGAPVLGPQAERAWQLIAHQVVPAWFPSSAKDTFNFNEGDPSASSFMNIGTLTPSDYSADGKYHLRLIYLESEADVPSRLLEFEWTQTSWITSDAVTGYEPITSQPVDLSESDWCTEFYTTSSLCRRFNGLARSSHASAVLDGSPGHICWFMAVGAIGSWQQGIPGFCGRAQTMSLYIFR